MSVVLLYSFSRTAGYFAAAAGRSYPINMINLNGFSYWFLVETKKGTSHRQNLAVPVPLVHPYHLLSPRPYCF